MTSMRREMSRLEKIQYANRRDGQRLGVVTRMANKARRMAEAVDNETLAERRERLTLHLGIAESIRNCEPQAEMLRQGLDELPPVGVCDGWRWGDFKALVAE